MHGGSLVFLPTNCVISTPSMYLNEAWTTRMNEPRRERDENKKNTKTQTRKQTNRKDGVLSRRSSLSMKSIKDSISMGVTLQRCTNVPEA